MKHRLLQIWLLSSVCLLLTPIISQPPPLQAQAPTQFTVTPAFEGNYVPGTWLPLQITLRNDGPAFTALVAAQLPNSISRYTLPVELPQGAQKVVTLYVAMEQETRSLLVTLERSDTASIIQQSVDVRPRRGERLLGVATGQTLVLSLPRRQDLQRLPFVSIDLPLADLPDQAEGLSSLTLLLLADVATETLTEAQQRALVGWVARGGHLVIGGGSGAQRTLAGLPETLRVATVGETGALDTGALGAFIGGPGPDALPGVTLKPLPTATVFGSEARPLWAQRDVGKGRITQLAFDPGHTSLREWTGTPLLWDQLLQPAFLVNGPFGPETTVDRFQEQTLTSAVGNLPALNLPPSDILFAILTIYTILIGPGVALILRRNDRQAWGWVVLPVLALSTTGIAFGLATRLRADQRVVSQVSLVEQVDSNQARARTLVGILSPQSDSFDISVAPAALTRPMRSTSGLFGAIGGAPGDYLQQTGAFSVTVARWELQGSYAEQQVAFPQLDAQILLGPEGIQAQVRNTTAQPLRDVVVAFGGQAARIGDIDPGQQERAAWPVPTEPVDEEQPLPGTSLSSLVIGAELEASRRPGSVPERRLLVREALANAAVTRGPRPPDDAPVVLAWLAQSPLEIAVDAPEAATQQITLLVTRPVIRGSGAVTLPRHWLRPDPTADGNATCSGSGGTGIAAQTSPVTVTLRLPGDLAALRTTALTLTLESERTWPNAGVTTELFDWNRQRWIDINYDGPGNTRVPEPEPFVRNGVLRMRLSGTINEANCLFVQAQPAGVLP